jgi:hypothetical protein
VPNPPPLDRSSQDALEKRERSVDRRPPHSVRFQFSPEALDHLRRDRIESHRAEPWQHMAIPQTRVAAKSASGEVRRGVELPPLLRKVGKRLPPAAEQIQVAGSLPPQVALGEKAGITGRSLSLIERGHANPTWGTVKGIADALNVSMGELGRLADRIG